MKKALKIFLYVPNLVLLVCFALMLIMKMGGGGEISSSDRSPFLIMHILALGLLTLIAYKISNKTLKLICLFLYPVLVIIGEVIVITNDTIFI